MQQQQLQQPPPRDRQMPTNITTEQIQKLLDENKQLILAILENQNLGKLSECAQYQAQLQKNLLYLAAIADAQPQIPAVRPQTIPNTPTLPPQGGPFVQQPAMYPPRPPLNFNPQVMPPFPQHVGERPGVLNGVHIQVPSQGGGSIEPRPSSPSLSEFGRDHNALPSGPADSRGGKHDPGNVSLESGGGQMSVELRSGNSDSTASHGQEDGGKVS